MNDRIVIDASVTLSWVLKEKGLQSIAEPIIDDFISGKITTIAPTIWLYETVNALRTAILGKRIKTPKINKYYQKILEISPNLLDFAEFAFPAFQIALKFDLSIYDASYVALAQEEDCTFYTADEKLYRKVSGKLPFVKLVSEYKP